MNIVVIIAAPSITNPSMYVSICPKLLHAQVILLYSFYFPFFHSRLWLSPFCQLFPLSIFSPMRLCTSLHLPQLIFSPSLSPFLSKSLDSLHPSALIMDRMQLQRYRLHGSRSWDTAVFGASVKPQK